MHPRQLARAFASACNGISEAIARATHSKGPRRKKKEGEEPPKHLWVTWPPPTRLLDERPELWEAPVLGWIPRRTR